MPELHTNILQIVVFLTVLFLVGGGFLVWNKLKSLQSRFLNRLMGMKDRFGNQQLKARPDIPSILAEGPTSDFESFLRDIVPKPGQLRARLRKTGHDIDLTQYLFANLIIAIVAFLSLHWIMGVPMMMSNLAAIFLGLGLPHLIVGKMIKSRSTAFLSLFPDAIDLITRSLRAGLPITEAISAVAKEIGYPVGIEFQKVTDEISFGKALEKALWQAADRIDAPDFRFFVISLSVQKETGGNLAETLDNLSDILRKRQSMKLKIRAMSAEGKASAFIVGALPFIMFGLILTINYDYASILFTDPRAIIIALAGLVWMALGIAIMAKMIRFEM